jgi:transketolase C-terminal domain/subunit
MSIEDIGWACSLPGFVVLFPTDEVSMRALVYASVAQVGSVFI